MIIDASEHLEYYDEQYDCEPFTEGIRVVEAKKYSTPEEMIAGVSGDVGKIASEKFVLGLGGDHAVTLGLVKGVAKNHKKFSVLVLDAHADFRDSWNGSSLNHACVTRQLAKEHSVGLIGVRAMDVDEAEAIKKENIPLIKAHEYSLDKVDALLAELEDEVYLSIDIDVFDPSFIRQTGTPEPGGLLWNDMLQLLERIFRKKNVIAADIVEFAPESDRAEAFSLAKLVYKLMALSVTFKKKDETQRR